MMSSKCQKLNTTYLMPLLILLPLLLLCGGAQVSEAVQQTLNITIDPPPDPDIEQGNDRVGVALLTDTYMQVNVTVFGLSKSSGNITFSIEDTYFADVSPKSLRWHGNSNSSNYLLNVTAWKLGWTNMEARFLADSNATSVQLNQTRWRVTILRLQTLPQIIYRVIIIVMVVLIVFGMGCTIDIRIVYGHVRRPVALMIGWCTQFVLMPHLALGIGQILLLIVGESVDNVPAFAFGLLTVGCSPGGGSSNAWTLLFGGDLDLSISMTFFSQICALFMMPLWLFVYSRLYINTDEVRIPYEQIAINLLQLVIPVVLGVLLRLKYPNLADRVRKVIRPFVLFFVLFVVTFGIIVNIYLYELIGRNPIVIPFAALLPWCGFLLAFCVGRILQLKRAQAIAISLECGIQNIGIPILILQFSMPKPDGDIASIVPLIVVMLTPIPLYFVLAAKRIRERLNRDKNYEMDEVGNSSDQKVDPPAVGGVQRMDSTAELYKSRDDE